ncbi:MAG: hypothetical protein HY820_04575 [Acidobacteria bacterium]|nr:hypothetical protein [Acidobacteriota bacterium]
MSMALQEQCAATISSADGDSPSWLFVSTSLATWTTANPEQFARDFQINDTVYRRLDPDYYAWLRSKMQIAKMLSDAGRLGRDEFEDLRQRFNAIQQWAVESFGESQLLDAIHLLDARDYAPPIPEPDNHGCRPRADDDAADALAMVDSIRDAAIALGWKRDALYRMPVGRRSSLLTESGLVCYIRKAWRIGEVTRQSIELIGPPPFHVRQRFYNPDIEQPWERRNRNEAK